MQKNSSSEILTLKCVKTAQRIPYNVHQSVSSLLPLAIFAALRCSRVRHSQIYPSAPQPYRVDGFAGCLSFSKPIYCFADATCVALSESLR
jgi:hypothetical protein